MSESGNKYTSDEKILKVARALSSQTRVDIWKSLIDKEKSITVLAREFNQTEANISAQVKILIDAELVEHRHEPGKHGRTKICTSSVKQIVLKIK